MSQKVYELITNQIIQKLEKGIIPWRKPWGSLEEFPKSLNTQKPYRGINAFLLSLSGFESPYWLTYRQASELGAQIRAGEKGLPVAFWKFQERGQDKEVFPEVSTKARADRGKPIVRFYTVFNVEQCENLNISKDLLFPKKPNGGEISDHAEKVVSAYESSPEIKSGGSLAYYSPNSDHIQMPERGSFHSSSDYYATLFHEMTHSTGHASRLARKGVTDPVRFGSHTYSKEELVAEMGAAFLSAHAGLGDDQIEQSAAYCGSWLKVLKGDTSLVVMAASEAQKAVDFILGQQLRNSQASEEVAS